MTKEELIKYIRENDAYFRYKQLENYSYQSLALLRIQIEIRQLNSQTKSTTHDKRRTHPVHS